MFQYLWTSVGAALPTIGEEEGTETGDKEEDHQPEETYLHLDMEAPLYVLTAKKKDIMHTTAPRKSSYPIMRGTTNKQTLLTYKKKGSKTMKCRMSKNQTL